MKKMLFFRWKTVPVGSTATVFLPGKNITEGSLPVIESEGVSLLNYENGTSVIKIGSGNYSFIINYVGKKNRGVRPSRFKRAGGKIIRVCLQDLEKLGFVKIDSEKTGRVLTDKGVSYLDKMASTLKPKETKKKEKPKVTKKEEKPKETKKEEK